MYHWNWACTIVCLWHCHKYFATSLAFYAIVKVYNMVEISQLLLNTEIKIILTQSNELKIISFHQTFSKILCNITDICWLFTLWD